MNYELESLGKLLNLSVSTDFFLSVKGLVNMDVSFYKLIRSTWTSYKLCLGPNGKFILLWTSNSLQRCTDKYALASEFINNKNIMGIREVKLFCLLQSDSYCLGSMFSGLWWRFSWILNFTPLYAVLFAKVIQIWFKHISSEVSMDFELENSWHFHPRWHSNVRNRTIDFVGNLNASLWRSPIGDAMVVARVLSSYVP